MQSDSTFKSLWAGIGLILILTVLAFNEWTYTFFFADLWISGQTQVNIWVANCALIVAGVVLIRKSRIRWAFDVSTILLITMALLLMVEGIFWGLNTVSNPALAFEGDFDPLGHHSDPNLGEVPTPNLKMSHIRKADGETLYDVAYTIDEYSRRVTPQSNIDDRDQFVLFFGCSFTFGTGVEDNETLPFYVSEQASHYRVYNYAFAGYGPHQMLAHLQRDELKTEIKESPGIAVYTFIDNHVNRANGMSNGVWGMLWDGPFYTLDSTGQLVRQGGFRWDRPVQSFLSYAVFRSHTAAYFNLSFPRMNEAHIDRTARIIEEARNTFESKFGSDEFYVALYPSRTPEAKSLILRLEQAHIQYLDYSKLFDGKGEGLTIAGDGHPSPAGHKLVAEQLAVDLGIADSRQLEFPTDSAIAP